MNEEPGESRPDQYMAMNVTYIAPLMMILVSLESPQSQLSNDAKIIMDGAM